MAPTDASKKQHQLSTVAGATPASQEADSRTRPRLGGRGAAFHNPKRHRFGTLLVVWDTGQKEPWIVITDLPPEEVGVCWYGLRIWIELGFRALKRVGW